MSNNFFPTVYAPVKVSDPESPFADQNHLYVKRPLDAVREPVEKLTNRYIFTKEELVEFLNKYADNENFTGIKELTEFLELGKWKEQI